MNGNLLETGCLVVHCNLDEVCYMYVLHIFDMSLSLGLRLVHDIISISPDFDQMIHMGNSAEGSGFILYFIH